MIDKCPAEGVMVIGTSAPFRAETLRRVFCGCFNEFITLPPDIDEKAHRASDPFKLTELVARAKLEAVLEKLKKLHPNIHHGVILTFDQVAVTREGEVREKPNSVEENKKFLASYSNNSVRTVAAYVAYSLDNHNTAMQHQETETFFSSYGDDVVDRVIARGVSLKSAGGFVVEDEELRHYVVQVDGTVEGVQGMHTPTVRSLLLQLGFATD